MYWAHSFPYWPQPFYYWFVPFRWWPWIVSIGKGIIGDGVAGATTLGDEAIGAAIGDAAAGVTTIGDDP